MTVEASDTPSLGGVEAGDTGSDGSVEAGGGDDSVGR